MSYGFPWSEAFVRQLEDKELRDEFVADQVRLRIAGLVRALRGQTDRDWSQAELGERMGKPQNVVSRLEDPDYGKMSLSTLLEVAAAFDLPLWVDIPEWEDWARLIRDVPTSTTARRSFNAAELTSQPALETKAFTASNVFDFSKFARTEVSGPTDPVLGESKLAIC
jgi:transcriptional regulator with XRE-family HTH domain